MDLFKNKISSILKDKIHHIFKEPFKKIEESKFDLNDHSYNYLINIPFKNIFHSQYVIYSFAYNYDHTAFLYLNPSFDFELIILKNKLASENIEFKNYVAFKLPDLKVFPDDFKTQENFSDLLKGNFEIEKLSDKIKFMGLKSIIQEKKPDGFLEYKFPCIHLVGDNRIVIETINKIYLVNFENSNSKITTLINKKHKDDLKIIFKYDENVSVTKTKRKFVRTYLFCLDKTKKLHYFFLEDDSIFNNEKKLILHKMPYAGDEIIEMLVICMTNKLENGKYFLFVFLNDNYIRFYLTDYYENDLGLILNSLNIDKTSIYHETINESDANQNILNSNIFNLDMTSCEKSPEKIPKILKLLRKSSGRLKYIGKRGSVIDYSKIEYHLNEESDIKRVFFKEENNKYFLIFLGEFNFYIMKFDSNLTPKNLREKFKPINPGINRGLQRFSNLFGIKGLSLSDGTSFEADNIDEIIKIERNGKITVKIDENKEKINEEDFDNFLNISLMQDYFYRIELRSLDYDVNDLNISIKNNTILVISKKKLYLINYLNNGKTIYNYKIKNDEFLGIFEFNQINKNQYLLSRKKFLKFRYDEEFKKFENFLIKLSEYKDLNLLMNEKEEKDEKFIEKNLPNVLYKLYFNILTEFDAYFNCEACKKNMNKSNIYDKICEHYEEYKLKSTFFFFNYGRNFYIKIKKFMREKNPSPIEFVIFFAHEYLNYTYDILEYIFSEIGKNNLVQEQLKYIFLMTNFMEMMGCKHCYNNHNLIYSSDLIEKLKFLINELVYLFINLKYLYIKFCIESGFEKIAEFYFNICKLQYQSGQMEDIKLKNLSLNNFHINSKEDDNKNFSEKVNIDKINSEIEKIKIYNYLNYYINSRSKFLKFSAKLNLVNQEESIISNLDKISYFFENFERDNRIISYLYLCMSYHLIKCHKFYWASLLLYHVYDLSKLYNFKEIEFYSVYNLGILNYSLGYFHEGIHNLQSSMKLAINNKLSVNSQLMVKETLAQAHINTLNFIHAYLNIKEAISILSYHNDLQSNLKINQLQIYLNFILEIMQQIGIFLRKESKQNQLSINKKKRKNFEIECKKLIMFIDQKGFDKTKHIFSLYSYEFLKLMQFLVSLTQTELNVLNEENKNETDPSSIIKEKKESDVLNFHKNQNSNHNQKDFTAFIQEKKDLRELNFKYNNEMELKKFYDILPKAKKEIFKKLNLDLLRRHVILKDPKDAIEHDNLNYHPIHTPYLMELIEDIKSDNKIRFLHSKIFKNEYEISNYIDTIQDKNLNFYFSFSQYINREDILKNLMIEDSLTKVKFNKKKPSKNPIFRINHISNEEKNSNKITFQRFYDKMLEVTEFKNISNINELLKKIYDEIEVNCYLLYIMEQPEIIKNFLFTNRIYSENDTKFPFEFNPNQQESIGLNKFKQMNKKNLKNKSIFDFLNEKKENKLEDEDNNKSRKNEINESYQGSLSIHPIESGSNKKNLSSWKNRLKMRNNEDEKIQKSRARTKSFIEINNRLNNFQKFKFNDEFKENEDKFLNQEYDNVSDINHTRFDEPMQKEKSRGKSISSRGMIYLKYLDDEKNFLLDRKEISNKNLNKLDFSIVNNN